MSKQKNKIPSKFHVKKGDMVEVISGNSKGTRGEVLEIFREKMRAIVDGAKMVKKHMKPSAENPQGDIVEQPVTIHISNLMVIDPALDEPRRTGRKRDENGKLQRYFKAHTSLKEDN